MTISITWVTAVFVPWVNCWKTNTASVWFVWSARRHPGRESSVYVDQDIDDAIDKDGDKHGDKDIAVGADSGDRPGSDDATAEDVTSEKKTSEEETSDDKT